MTNSLQDPSTKVCLVQIANMSRIKNNNKVYYEFRIKMTEILNKINTEYKNDYTNNANS